jgi:hypothetical protein
MSYTSRQIQQFYHEEQERLRYILQHSQPPTTKAPVYAPNQTVSQAEAVRMEARNGQN